jgi:hypothetical protein
MINPFRIGEIGVVRFSTLAAGLGRAQRNE